MELKINTEHNELTPLEQCYLACIYNNLSTELDFSLLMENDYITEHHTLTEKGKDLFNPKISSDFMFFISVYNQYPHKVSDRVLKAKSIDSGDGNHCLKKYNQYLKQDPLVGEKMLKGLLNEITLRKKGNSEQYFQDIKTWFNQRTWDKYFDLEISDTQERVERI